MCPLVLQKLVLSIPFLHGWQGSCGHQIQANGQWAMRQMPVQEHNLGFRDEAGSWGTSSTPDQKTNIQHMLNQPRGSCPDTLEAVFRPFLYFPEFSKLFSENYDARDSVGTEEVGLYKVHAYPEVT